MSTKAVFHMRGGGKEVALAGQPMAFLLTGEHTKYTSMFDWTLAPGFATGLHMHKVQEETFFVLEGECQWQVGEETVRAEAGAFLFVPPATPHNIINASNRPARLLMTVSPPGHEHYFEELAREAARSDPPDSQAIAELRSRYDTLQLSTLKIR